MSRNVPLLTEVYLRAWGTDDPRVLPPLRAENQPGRTYRAHAVERRAIDAGYPVLDLDDRRRAATAAMRQLEGMDWTWSTDRLHHLFAQTVPYESRWQPEPAVRVAGPVNDFDEGPVSIFDE